MEQTDPGKAERVWSRVMCAQNIQNVQAACPCKADGSLSGEKLAELANEELQSCAFYRSLACMACGCAQKTLLCIAEQERCHAKKLAVIYFLATGRKFCPSCPRPACTACLNEALRQAYKEELEAAQNYCLLAERAGSHACTLQELARQEKEHACALACILQNTL